jgi:hypothetical protein
MADSNVVTSTPDSEVHGEHYSATDSRNEAHGPWLSVDDCSGEVTADNWSSVASRFPDTGRWRQT